MLGTRALSEPCRTRLSKPIAQTDLILLADSGFSGRFIALAMLVLAKTDPTIEKHEGLHERITSTVEAALSYRSEHITRIEILVSDQTGDQTEGERQMRCVMEARLEHRQPVAVTHLANTVDRAVIGAAGRLIRMIDNSLGRGYDRPIPGRQNT